MVSYISAPVFFLSSSCVGWGGVGYVCVHFQNVIVNTVLFFLVVVNKYVHRLSCANRICLVIVIDC